MIGLGNYTSGIFWDSVCKLTTLIMLSSMNQLDSSPKTAFISKENVIIRMSNRADDLYLGGTHTATCGNQRKCPATSPNDLLGEALNYCV